MRGATGNYDSNLRDSERDPRFPEHVNFFSVSDETGYNLAFFRDWEGAYNRLGNDLRNEIVYSSKREEFLPHLFAHTSPDNLEDSEAERLAREAAEAYQKVV